MNQPPRIDIYREIPDFEALRELKKQGYLNHPIDTTHPLYEEKLVPISAYGVSGTGYYSRPNRVTTDPLPGINPTVFVRQSVGEKLAAANEYLRSDQRVADALDGEVEVDIRDGYRSLQLQNELHETHYPALLRRLNQDMSEDEIMTRRDAVIAKGDPRSPHVSGGAVDLNLKYIGTDEAVFTAQGGNIAKDAVNPEFLENTLRTLQEGNALDVPEEIQRLSRDELMRAVMARRILYNVMVSDTIGGLAMVVNPNETWHFGAGDTLAAFVTSHLNGTIVPAYYGSAPEPAEYRTSEVTL